LTNTPSTLLICAPEEYKGQGNKLVLHIYLQDVIMVCVN